VKGQKHLCAVKSTMGGEMHNIFLTEGAADNRQKVGNDLIVTQTVRVSYWNLWRSLGKRVK
jgi:hypothetical protein